MKLILKQFALVFIAVFLNLATNPTLLSAQSAISKESRIGNAVIAHFEESLIDLSKDWAEARACWSDGEKAECFRTESQLDSQINLRFTHVSGFNNCQQFCRIDADRLGQQREQYLHQLVN